jgi:hypothetical protein
LGGIGAVIAQMKKPNPNGGSITVTASGKYAIRTNT